MTPLILFYWLFCLLSCKYCAVLNTVKSKIIDRVSKNIDRTPSLYSFYPSPQGTCEIGVHNSQEYFHTFITFLCICRQSFPIPGDTSKLPHRDILIVNAFPIAQVYY